ncbi:hypothetical protein ILT44_07000 [Microvirga sp. BT689]|uniref:hypothetical protein n=1 Tax=Microvirga arvi TaxID=2778731 RepID=UPI00194E3263|nr:hypothetical protein [Microvirga arvi]MBM6579923.1 hypothetical protein [Microvirga arvi]
MPRLPESPIAKSDDAARDLLDALNRLRRGSPIHPDLRKLKEEGKLRINVATVAKEARRSRTLIGSNKCAYPQIRAEVLAAAEVAVVNENPKAPRKHAREIIGDLRRENAILKSEKAVLATRLQDAINVAWDLQKKLAKAGRKGKLIELRRSHPNQIVGRSTVVRDKGDEN